MSKIKTLSLFLLMFAVLTLTSFVPTRAAPVQHSRPLRVLAWPQTLQVKSGSPWILHIGLDNVSDKDIHVLFSHLDTSTDRAGNSLLPLKVSVTSSTGQHVKSIGPVFKLGPVQDNSLTNLESGQFCGFDVNMANLYRLPVGRYDVAFFYDSSGMKGAMVPAKRLWRGHTDVVHVAVNVE